MSGVTSTSRIVLIFLFILWGIGLLDELKQDDESRLSTTRVKRRNSTGLLHISPLSKNSTVNDTLTIVVQLSGELGNHLSKMGNGLCVQHAIETELGIPTEIKLRAQDHSKWQHAMQWTKAAFNSTRALNFRELNTPKFDLAHNAQRTWMQNLIDGGRLNVTGIAHPHILTDGLDLDKTSLDNLLNLLNQTWTLRNEASTIGDAPISTPHVYTNSFLNDYCLDRTYDDLRDFFVIHEADNCKARPYPNETVVHLRNFIAEMPRRGMELGFEEMNETRMATELLADLEPGQNIAIISRMDNTIDKYVNMMEVRGLKVRYIRGQNGNQDFCFLAKAQKEIIVTHTSSYAYWAGIIGDAKKVRLYSLDTPRTRANGRASYTYNYTNLELRKRFVFENY